MQRLFRNIPAGLRTGTCGKLHFHRCYVQSLPGNITTSRSGDPRTSVSHGGSKLRVRREAAEERRGSAQGLHVRTRRSCLSPKVRWNGKEVRWVFAVIYYCWRALARQLPILYNGEKKAKSAGCKTCVVDCVFCIRAFRGSCDCT